jgi:hypothetical protein
MATMKKNNGHKPGLKQIIQAKAPEKAPETTQTPAQPAPTAPAGMTIKEEDQQALRQIDQQAIQARLDLANLTLDFESKKSQVIARLTELQKVYSERLKAAAAACGQDISQGKWNFDMQQMVLTKID